MPSFGELQVPCPDGKGVEVALTQGCIDVSLPAGPDGLPGTDLIVVAEMKPSGLSIGFLQSSKKPGVKPTKVVIMDDEVENERVIKVTQYNNWNGYGLKLNVIDTRIQKHVFII